MATIPPPPNEPTPEDIARFVDQAEQQFAPTPDPEGYTPEVVQWEAHVAEADRMRDLPTGKILEREAGLAEERGLADLKTRSLVSRLQHRGVRERAKLTAQAESATARRGLDTNPHVQALTLTRRRAARCAMLWSVLILALAYTMVNVQRFAAGGTTAADPRWWVAWAVDPVLSALVVALLLTKGDLAGVKLSETTAGRWSVWGVEIGALVAQLLMNVAPTIPGAWQVVALHIVIPLAAVAAALVLPVVQGRYAIAIAELSALSVSTPTGPTMQPTGCLTPLTQPKYSENVITPVGGTAVVEPPSTAELVGLARDLVTRGDLPPDPSANLLRTVLKVGTGTARTVRDQLREHRP